MKITRRLLAVSVVALLFLLPAARPAAALTTTYVDYLKQVQPTLHQWWTALESMRGFHFLLEPRTDNTDTANEMAALLGQWWTALEGWRGAHFLIQPSLGAIDTRSEIYQVLNQWEDALEAWRGLNFLQEPPIPPIPTKTGTFELTPRKASVVVGEPFTHTVVWTVPPHRGWRDLETIDVRICSGESPLLLVRWEEPGNTFSIFDPAAGVFSPPALPGTNVTLETEHASLLVAESSAEGSGPEGRTVTLTLTLVAKPSAAGLRCDVEVRATDDLGAQERFRQAGRLSVVDAP
jgi:hypothetical protein